VAKGSKSVGGGKSLPKGPSGKQQFVPQNVVPGMPPAQMGGVHGSQIRKQASNQKVTNYACGKPAKGAK
jgi:hypothetical protein